MAQPAGAADDGFAMRQHVCSVHAQFAPLGSRPLFTPTGLLTTPGRVDEGLQFGRNNVESGPAVHVIDGRGCPRSRSSATSLKT